VIEGAWWENVDGALPAVDVPGQGWRGALQLDHDIGFAHIRGGVALVDVEGPFGRGRYLDAGIELRRTFKLSRWTKLWISLGFGIRNWRGDLPPAGEADAGAIMFGIGGTFR
jgi:hypothetical protein